MASFRSFKDRFSNKIPFLTVTICLLLSSACSPTDQFAKIVDEWRGKQVIIPDSVMDALTGKIIATNDADFTILTYVDSTGCTNCKLQLPLWESFIASLDSIPDVSTNILMIIHSKDKREELNFLKQHAYYHPVILDEENAIDNTNAFPKNPIFQTFLLDKSHRVIAIGNPIVFQALNRLYLSIISGEQTIARESNTIIKIGHALKRPVHLQLDEAFKHDFSLINIGNDTVFIDDIRTSCECISTEMTQNYITPQDSLKATIHLQSDSIEGPFFRTVHIHCKDFDYPSVIRIIGNR